MRMDGRLRKMSISKAFRAVFPKLPPHMLNNIRKWADNHLALSTMFSDDTQRPVLVGLHNRARNTSSFARMLRSALEKMAMPRPRGHFVKLLSVQEVLAVCAGGGASRERAPTCPLTDEDPDVRIVHV